MSASEEAAVTHQWLIEPLPKDVAQSLERLARSDDVRYLAVMPDVHLANEVCVGVATATTRLLYPNAVGGDIGCGMAAIGFDASATLLQDEAPAAKALAALYRHVPGNRHSRATKPAGLPEHLANSPLSHPLLESIKRRDGVVQLGTLGRGNHFLEFQRDDQMRLWLMVHSGSRAIGQAIRDHHLLNAGSMRTGLRALDVESTAGQTYLADAQWAGRYAAANRRAMIDAAVEAMRELFGVEPVEASFFDCDHNHLRREVHHGCELWVHRKGANSASDGERGIIPGSMGSASFHVEGRGDEDSLRSSSHGAGRALSRDAARRRISVRALHRQLKGVWFDHRAASKLVDEAPAAYKAIDAVMRAQRPLVRISRRLHPILCYKG